MSQRSSSAADAFERTKAVQSAHETELMSKANVVGVGIGLRHVGGARTDQVALVVMVRNKVSPSELALDDVIPAEIDGVPVDVQEVGEIQAY